MFTPTSLCFWLMGGKVIDYTGEPGYFTVKNSSMPSLFNGQLKEAVSESFDRIRFGGQTPTAQKVYFINLQEIKGIKFGTPNPINYFDQFYNAELFLRAHGTYSIKVTDPILFYAEAVPKNADHIEVEDINGQYLSEFLEALQSSINQMSADGIRISYVASKGRELGQYMSDVLDDQWRAGRGIEIQSVGIASISYDEDSKSLIQMRNQGAMLSDPGIREGYVQGAAARGDRGSRKQYQWFTGRIYGHGYGNEYCRWIYGSCFRSQCKSDADESGSKKCRRTGNMDLQLRQC